MNARDIKRLRKSLGLTRPQFAEKLGVDRTTVFRWETGSRALTGLAERFVKQFAADAKAASEAKVQDAAE